MGLMGESLFRWDSRLPRLHVAFQTPRFSGTVVESTAGSELDSTCAVTGERLASLRRFDSTESRMDSRLKWFDRFREFLCQVAKSSLRQGIDATTFPTSLI